MTVLVVRAAYGRQYKSAKAAKADWIAGKDFQIVSLFASGQYVNKNDDLSSVSWINIRYANDSKVAVINLKS